MRAKRRFIRTEVELANGARLIRKSWTYGHTQRALLNAHRNIQGQYPDWRVITSNWETMPNETHTTLRGAA